MKPIIEFDIFIKVKQIIELVLRRIHPYEKGQSFSIKKEWLMAEGYGEDAATAVVLKQNIKTRLIECRVTIEQVQDPNFKTLLQKSVDKKTEHIRKLEAWLETHR
jgi:hypothetical protein